MKSISSKPHFFIVGVVYAISLVFFDKSPAFRIFHCIFDETENSLFQMALLCGICLLINLKHASSVLYIITACLAPYGLISTLIVICTSTLGFSINISIILTLPVLYRIMKEPWSDSNCSISISEKTLCGIFEEYSVFMSWAIFPINTLLASNLIYIVVVYIL